MTPTTDTAQIRDAQKDDERSATELIDAYADGPRLLRSAIAGMTAEQLLARPQADRMTTQEVVCHVADCEQFLADRMKRTVAMDRPLLVGVDGWLYVDALSYAERDLDLDLAVVEATRAQMAADLHRLDSDAWSRCAVHTETGLVTLRQLLLHSIRHLEHHVRTIDEKRALLRT